MAQKAAHRILPKGTNPKGKQGPGEILQLRATFENLCREVSQFESNISHSRLI